jgi:mycothiol synthase
MSHITSRIYETKKDIRTIIELIDRVRPPQHRNDYPNRVDLEEAFASAIVRKNIRLWFDDRLPIAWVYVDNFNNLVLELDLQYAVQIGVDIIEWAEACIRRNLSRKQKGTLYANCREDYAERIAFLKQYGFSQMEETTITLIRPLSMAISDPELLPGFVIRPLLGNQEAEAVAAMHRASLGTEYMTTENRLIIMSTSRYDPTLDLVAVAPDGSIAANCICSVNPQTGIGFTDPISTHPQFQRMGLARALLLTGLILLKERGMTYARLGTSGENIRMQKTAESAGFRIESKTIWFSKEVN